MVPSMFQLFQNGGGDGDGGGGTWQRNISRFIDICLQINYKL